TREGCVGEIGRARGVGANEIPLNQVTEAAHTDAGRSYGDHIACLGSRSANSDIIGTDRQAARPPETGTHARRVGAEKVAFDHRVVSTDVDAEEEPVEYQTANDRPGSAGHKGQAIPEGGECVEFNLEDGVGAKGAWAEGKRVGVCMSSRLGVTIDH